MSEAIDALALLPEVRDQGERNTCLSLALTDGHHIARRLGPALSSDYLHFHAARRAKVEVNAALPIASGCQALSEDGQSAEEACPYSHKLRANDWQPPFISGPIWRRRTTIVTVLAFDSVASTIRAGGACVLVLRINDQFIAGAQEPERLVYDRSGPDRGNHAVLGVGTRADAIFVRNSWGSDWSHDGYAWISAAYLLKRYVAVIEYHEELN